MSAKPVFLIVGASLAGAKAAEEADPGVRLETLAGELAAGG